MYNLNILSDGNKPVGPIGLKKAEKELIMRRYKYNNQHPSDNINRIYGQQKESPNDAYEDRRRAPGAYYGPPNGERNSYN